MVEFADGRFLEVISHRIQGDRVRLEVDRGSYMVIPLEQIDTIRTDREVVYRAGDPGAETAAAEAVAGDLPARRAQARTAVEAFAAGG